MQLSWLSCAEELFHACFYSAIIVVSPGLLLLPLEGRPVTRKVDGGLSESDVPLQGLPPQCVASHGADITRSGLPRRMFPNSHLLQGRPFGI